MDKPRLLSLNAFSWDANPLCNRFQSCNDNEGFVEVWKKYIDPYLQKDTGKFSAEPDELSSTQAMDTEFSSLQPASSTPPPPPPPPGRAKRKSVSTPSLTPASKSARVEQDEKMDTETTSFDEEGMDKTIQENFLGELLMGVQH